MPTFIKTGFWEQTCKTCKGYNGWLNLDDFLGGTGTSGTSGVSGTSGTSGTNGQQGDRYQTTSSTSFTLGVGGTITVGTGLAYTTAQDILISYDINNHQVSMVTSYNPATGVLVFGAPSEVIGSGTYSSWGVNLNGAAGGNGTNGTSGTAGTSATSGTSGINGLAQGYYGSFFDTTNQAGGSIRPFTLNTTDFSNGVSIQNSSEITFTHLGKFNIAFSAQLIKTGGTKTYIWFWLRHNNVDVPDSATVVEMGNNNDYLVAAWNFFINVNSNPQQFQLMWYTPSGNVSIGAIADVDTPAGVPAVPSIILTVNQVG